MANFIKHFYSKKVTVKISNFFISPVILNHQRFYSSVLFVPGNKANKIFAYLSPEIDFNDRISDIQKFQNELNLRGVNVDLQELKKAWEYYQRMISNKNTFEKKVIEISARLGKIYKLENPSSDEQKEKEELDAQNKLAKKELRSIKEAIWEIEEKILPKILKLPNELDERIPKDSSILLKTVGNKPNIPDNAKQSHLDIGKNLGLLEYINPIQCYLCNEAALFELEVLTLAGKILNKNNVIRLSCPDFSRSILVEGCGMDHESPTSTFILQNTDHAEENDLMNRLHLTGGANLPGLLAIYIKQSFKPRDFPVKVFATGRHYEPFPNISTAYGLFSVCQASAVQALTFVEKKNSEEYKNEFQKLIEITSEIYDEIGCHYRIVMRSAKELNLSESIRVSFEMWSVHSNQYIEVGHVSASGDYFTKRLMIATQTSKSCSYPSTISGTLLSVPRVLACLIEENSEKFVLPQKIAEFLR